MWSGCFKDRDLKMKLCSLLLCCVLAVQNVRAVRDSQNETTWTQDFSAGLFELLKESQPQNFVLSPLSVRNAVTMLSLGAAGETAAEFQRVLQLPADPRELITRQSKLISSLNNISSPTSGLKFVTGDAVFVTSKIRLKQQFKNAVAGLGGLIERTDFANGEAAAKKINVWVQNKTDKKIEKIVDPSALNDQISLLLLNSIYFKGSWEHKFNVPDTKQRPFFLNASCSVNVSMMFQQQEFPLAELKEPNVKVILLPYQGERLSMMIYLPDGEEESSLDSLENWLKLKSPFEIQREHLNKNEPVTVSLSLPKFKIRSSLQLNEPLTKLGLGKMFDQAEANFSGIFSNSGRFFVSKVIQETFVEVNEEGTEAAAATGSEVSATSVGSSFRANRPFLFQIVDSETKTVLFSGRVKNPLDAADSSAVDCGTDERTSPGSVPGQEGLTNVGGGDKSVKKVLRDLSRVVGELELRMGKVEEMLKREGEAGRTTTTTITTTEVSQEQVESFFSSSAWGYTGTGLRWVYRPVFPTTTCANLVGTVNTVFLDGVCVMLYRLEDCSGQGFQLDQTNSLLGQDIQKQFPCLNLTNVFTAPKSIGVCL